MGAAAGYYGALDGGGAGFAWLAGAHVYAMFELEEAFLAVGVYVVGDGGAAAIDGLAEDGLEGFAEAG
jgi:hypothetical protein